MVKAKSQKAGSNALERSTRDLSSAVGDFIRCWGFRRIHGEIWTQLFLSKEPMSGSQLVSALGVSKALVSPALQELLRYGLIHQVPGADERSKQFIAECNVFAVISKILQSREIPMLRKIQEHYTAVSEQVSSNPGASGLEASRLASLGMWIAAASLGLEPLAMMSSPDQFIGLIEKFGSKSDS